MGGATVFGIFTGILGLVSFFQDNIPKGPRQYEANYRIAVGLNGRNGQGLQNAQGQVPDIRVWNENGVFLGARYDPGRVESGSFRDITVSLREKNQPTYALFTGNDDAVCIAYITSTWADGSSYGWIGNWADKDACKRSWYYSNIYQDGRKLNCAWLDRNGDQPVTGIQIHFPEFKEGGGMKRRDKKYYCAQNPSLKFRYDWEPNSVNYWTKMPSKRMVPAPENLLGEQESAGSDDVGYIPDIQPLPVSYNETRLVQSIHEEHSAIGLCESETSRGPDLVSLHENTFCDMDTREVFPLCQGAVTEDCFDMDTREVRASAARIRARGEPVAKEYSDVLEWD